MSEAKQKTTCYHCGEECREETLHHDDHDFCCHGCQTVYTLLKDTGLCSYYDIDQASPGSTIQQKSQNLDYLDLEQVQRQFIDFQEGNQSKVTFYLPSMHCAACIWLLEKLEKLHQGVIRTEVNFIRKELTVFFRPDTLSLKALVLLLEDLGYPPDLSRERNRQQGNREQRKTLLLKLGVAGFAFGNIMLFSFPEYLSLDVASMGPFSKLFGYLNLALAIPVLLYSDTDYLRSAWKSLRLRYLTIDVPIALGIITLFVRSSYDVLSGSGTGYFDSFAGLIFFLLIGKWYQSRTYEALAFDRDFRSYFPVAVARIRNGEEEVCMLEDIRKGDRLRILNNQVIPADAVLVKGSATIDYSFVSGESDRVEKTEGDFLYAGGRQCSGIIEIEVVRDVSQGYLTSLWNQSAFDKHAEREQFSELIDRVSKYFSIGILAIAFLSLFYWLWMDPSQALDAFTSVLIIACPCALALAMPFAAGNVSRVLGKLGFFVKNSATLEQLSNVDSIVFDKTGTITQNKQAEVHFHGDTLSAADLAAVKALTSVSTHPLSVAVRNAIPGRSGGAPTLTREAEGQGLEATIGRDQWRIGSASWCDAEKAAQRSMHTSEVYVRKNDLVLGHFTIQKHLRPGMTALIDRLKATYPLHLLTGDNPSAEADMRALFGPEASLHFQQSPMDKLRYIQQLRGNAQRPLMLGDGLNDAGALKEASVGVAVADDVFSFSPACDAILQAERLPHLYAFIRYIRRSLTVVKVSIGISLLYNAVGLFFAVQGALTPVFAAILMPLSSVTVVAFVTLLTYRLQPRLPDNPDPH